MFINCTTELIREGNRLYTKKVKIYENISDEDLRKVNKYLYNLPSIQFGFICYKEDLSKGKVKGSCLSIENIIKNEKNLLSYINKNGLNENLLNVLDYFFKYC